MWQGNPNQSPTKTGELFSAVCLCVCCHTCPRRFCSLVFTVMCCTQFFPRSCCHLHAVLLLWLWHMVRWRTTKQKWHTICQANWQSCSLPRQQSSQEGWHTKWQSCYKIQHKWRHQTWLKTEVISCENVDLTRVTVLMLHVPANCQGGENTTRWQIPLRHVARMSAQVLAGMDLLPK